MNGAGEGHVPSYQISATPFVTSSQIATGAVIGISFPQVTKFVRIKNRATGSNINLHVGFTQRGLTTSALSNFFVINSGETFSEEIRVDRLFLSNSSGSPVDFSLLAGLTPIHVSHFTVVTGSNGYGGVG